MLASIQDSLNSIIQNLNDSDHRRAEVDEMMTLEDFFFEVQHFEAAKTSRGDDFSSQTLAELYASQGHFQRAISIYKRLLRADPGSQSLAEKLETLRLQIKQRKSLNFPQSSAVPSEATQTQTSLTQSSSRRAKNSLEHQKIFLEHLLEAVQNRPDSRKD